MGEHKLNRNMITQQMHDELAKAAVDKGKIMEIGWISMLRHVIPAAASDEQVTEMRKAFFLGAQHLFASINSFLDPDAEPTERDLERMMLLFNELEAFRKEFTSHHTAPGRAQ